MADDSSVSAVLPRYLALHPGRETIVAALSSAASVDLLKLRRDAARGRRAIPAAQIARAPEGAAEESAPPADRRSPRVPA